MCSHGEIHFVLMFCFLLFDDGTVDQHFRYVVCNKVCLLSPIEHTVYDGEEKYTAHTYIENAKVDANLLKMRFQVGHIRGMMQYLADNGIEIMYIRNSLIYTFTLKIFLSL
mgnify:CR=1 FL=1